MRTHPLVRLATILILSAMLAGCALPAFFGGRTLDGNWERSEMIVRRSIGPDQPVIQPPFVILGTRLQIDESSLTLAEEAGTSYRLHGQAEDWACALTGAYQIPIQINYTSETSGQISWRAEDLAALPARMTESWGNLCVYRASQDGIPTPLEDQAPLVDNPTLSITFELLEDGKLLALTARFETLPAAADGTVVLIERAYIYTRVR